MGLIRTTLLRGIDSLVGAAPAGSVTVLDDDSVAQTLPVVPDIARRSLTSGETGWWTANLDNVHTAADEETSQINPYKALAAVPAGSAYPVSVPATQDLWLIGASLVRVSGAADLVGGFLAIDPIARQQAFGIEDDGSAVVVSGEIPLVFWGPLNTDTAVDWGVTLNDQVYTRIALRLPRNTNLLFRSTSAGTATFRVVLILGLFQQALGQDVAT